MSLLDILYTMLLGPLELVLEVIYTIANRFTGDPGLAIIILSLIVNLLVFLLYRQNNDKYEGELKRTISLLLEVPFLIAAYNFLSNLQTIQDVPLGPIADLGVPDAMLTLGGITINVLPVLMTLVGLAFGPIYSQGYFRKIKILPIGIAVAFGVLLYQAPAGLTLYWLLNNVFVVLASIVKRKIKLKLWKKSKVKNNRKVFILGAIFLTILVGGVIPSSLISLSPQEFIDISYFYNPMWYIVNTFCFAGGTFLVWMGVFYWLASPCGKVAFDRMVWILSGIMLVNYMFFGTDLGIISANLQYENGLKFDTVQILINLLVVIVVASVLCFVILKFGEDLIGVFVAVIIAFSAMTGLNIVGIQQSASEAEIQANTLKDQMPQFSLSTEGHNVIVLMLDRAMGEYIPYLFNEKPDLQEQFAGFTYYSNVISHGLFTNFGAPGLFGGYEYTPVEMNKRNAETLVSKHNEALKVMPVLFLENGYDVTVCDPVYANYQWIPDVSIYDEYPEINTYITEGAFGETASKEYKIQNNKRNFFCYSIMKSMPLFLQSVIYEGGNYNQAKISAEGGSYSVQVLENNLIANGINDVFMQPYNVLVNLSNITKISKDSTNTFVMMANNTTHEPMLLQMPEYEPKQRVDNTRYADNADNYTINGITLKMETAEQVTHYHTNMATMIQLGKWFDYMRENGVYDNTRIILVSDHGRPTAQIEELIYEGAISDMGHLEFYYPLLMVKDFNSQEFSVSEEFMTNADVPTLAVNGIIENPVNPFTGKKINNEEKIAHDQYIIYSSHWDVNVNNGNTFLPAKWLKVRDDIWNHDNWELFVEDVILPEEVN